MYKQSYSKKDIHNKKLISLHDSGPSGHDNIKL